MQGKTNAVAAGGLNFRLQGGELRPEPRENTLWLPGHTGPLSWCLAQNQPEAPEPDQLWIRILRQDDRAVDLLDRNRLLLSLGPVRRYAGSRWTMVEGWLAAGNQWRQISRTWQGELYRPGDPVELITGGWSEAVTVQGGSWGNGEILEGPGGLELTGGKNRASLLCTEAMVDPEDYSYVEVRCSEAKAALFRQKRLVLTRARDLAYGPGSSGTVLPEGVMAYGDIQADGTARLPISTREPFYVGILVAGNGYRIAVDSVSLGR